jgi:hypothetical protein
MRKNEAVNLLERPGARESAYRFAALDDPATIVRT